ncbi:MAG TPA: nucleotide exchange factor GrpE [Candidatus Acidoferrales bacterium]|nr:nucleotide exchange factor GrpE [Candidatus Acidoferrales bacterium]
MSPHNHEHRKKGNDPEERPASAQGGASDSEAAVAAARAAGELEAGSGAQDVQKLLAEKQELMDTLVRRQADFENYRKRVERERQAASHRGVELMVEQLLPVLDAFDNALAGEGSAANAEYRKGFEIVRRQIWDVLSKQGVKRIDSVGKDFDPHLHHALDRVETTAQADGTIVGELQPGYTFHDRVLRPAMVRVAAEPVSKSAREN